MPKDDVYCCKSNSTPSTCAGKPPSSFVPGYSVYGEAINDKDCPWSPRPLLTHATRRMLEKAERQKLMDSRHIVIPGKQYCILFIVTIWAFSSYLCTASVGRVLQYVYCTHSAIFLHTTSQCFSFWLLHSLVGIFQRIFRLSEQSSPMVVVSCCTEYLHRAIAARLGKPTPYDQTKSNLHAACTAQYREWKLRIARRDFQKALKRKRITTRESILLLTEYAESYYETSEEEVVQGVFPVELSEAEAFLKLDVEESAPSNEPSATTDVQVSEHTTALAPETTLKSYLDTDKVAANLECLSAIAQSVSVSEFWQFSISDRIVVDFDKWNGDEKGCEENDDDDGDNDDRWNTDDDKDSDDEDGDQQKKDSGCPCPYCSMVSERVGKMTASVVSCNATLCFVHFDGEPALMPIPVPIYLCSKLDETPFLTLKDTESTQDASFVEDVSGAENEK